MAHRFAHERERGEVQDPVEPLAQRLVDRVAIEQIRDHQTGARRDRVAVAALEVVEHDDVVSGAQQVLGDDRSDVAGPAGDEQLHRRLINEPMSA